MDFIQFVNAAETRKNEFGQIRLIDYKRIILGDFDSVIIPCFNKPMKGGKGYAWKEETILWKM